MKSVIECVANFSEGLDRSVLDRIVTAIRAVSGVHVLDLQMDADHNRSVVTFVGTKDTIGEAALRGIGKAVELIDLNKHSGKHPRIGAADVVPFVPICGASLEDCVSIAHQVGRETFRRFGVPVYLYEAAAKDPERVRLETIRRGSFEGLRSEIEKNPKRVPDFGPPRLHPTAGATVVGARGILIAYNILLNTSDVNIARKIARTIRESDGGLRHVKALGIYLSSKNQAQVSMNLTSLEDTPLHTVFDQVRLEAERYGIKIVSSELVGLIPRRALEQVAASYLQLENFGSESVLETQIEKVLHKSDDSV